MQQVMTSVPDKRLHMFVVWLPVIWTDDKEDALERSKEFLNSRVSYYWDEKGITGKSWESVLGLDSIAWDVYLVYGSDKVWNGNVPVPTFWMHQLHGVKKAPDLDRAQFEQKIRDVIGRLPKEL